ncbi:MAG: bacteriocin-protection protein, partial [Blastocatellia bacterium]
MKIRFFKSPADFRKWLEKHHATVEELWVGYYKKSSGKPSITWPESVDQALCFGWIDGIRKSVDELSYKIRFTPRRPGSIWSSINIKRAQQLQSEGLMLPEGLKAFQVRKENRSGIYSYEQRSIN